MVGPSGSQRAEVLSCGTGVPPVAERGQDARATASGRDRNHSSGTQGCSRREENAHPHRRPRVKRVSGGPSKARVQSRWVSCFTTRMSFPGRTTSWFTAGPTRAPSSPRARSGNSTSAAPACMRAVSRRGFRPVEPARLRLNGRVKPEPIGPSFRCRRAFWTFLLYRKLPPGQS